jgi:hypothetical protein
VSEESLPIGEQRPDHLAGLSNAEAAALCDHYRRLLVWFRAAAAARGADPARIRHVDLDQPWVGWATAGERAELEWAVSLAEQALTTVYMRLTALRINRADGQNTWPGA